MQQHVQELHDNNLLTIHGKILVHHASLKYVLALLVNYDDGDQVN